MQPWDLGSVVDPPRRCPLDALSSTRFVTPSAHRVHHGSNPEYLDKNFGSMLILWDRLFGTYAPETVPVRYGLVGGKRVTTPAQALAGGYPAWSPPSGPSPASPAEPATSSRPWMPRTHRAHVVGLPSRPDDGGGLR